MICKRARDGMEEVIVRIREGMVLTFPRFYAALRPESMVSVLRFGSNPERLLVAGPGVPLCIGVVLTHTLSHQASHRDLGGSRRGVR